MSEVEDKIFEKYDIPCFDYTDYPHKSFWSEEMGDAQYRDALMETFSEPHHAATTLYVHIPFCVKLCYFCICHKDITRHYQKVKDHLYGSLFPEIDLLQQHFDHTGIRPNITEVFLGGGSPTIMEFEEFDFLLHKIKHLVDIEGLSRFCVEVDPRNVTEEKLRFYKSRGVSVISIGIQDFDPKVQQAVNRTQPYELVRDTLSVARELFTSINFDLLAGLPYQTEESIRKTVELVVGLAPDRISFDYFRYNEKFYPYMRILNRLGAFPNGQTKRKIMAAAAAEFVSAGYVRTGFEHFALPSDKVAQALALGNATYTSLGAVTGGSPNVIAVGRSGHGIIGENYLFQNHYDQIKFKKAIDAEELPVYRGHKLTKDDVVRRDIIRKVRTYFYADIDEIVRKRQSPLFGYFYPVERKILDHFIRDGLVTLNNSDRVTITEQGIHFAELIASTFDSYTNAGLLTRLEQGGTVHDG